MVCYERLLSHPIFYSTPHDGGFVYFTPIHPMHYRVYSTPQNAMWCCVGTGLENHGKYTELIYAHSKDSLYVNLFIPSLLQWKSKSLKLIQETRFPMEDGSSLKLSLKKPELLTIGVRVPEWVNNKMSVTVNGQRVSATTAPSGYVFIRRTWKNGDVVKIHLPMEARTEGLPDSTHWVSFLYGPIVLAAATDTLNMPGLYADTSRWGQIAHGNLRPMSAAPVLELEGPGAVSLQSTGQPLEFTVNNFISGSSFSQLKLVPFYKVHDSRYMLYWPYAGRAERSKLPVQQNGEGLRLDSLTVDRVYAGEQQPEADHQFEDGGSTTGVLGDQHFRVTQHWFAYTLQAPAAGRYQLYVRYRYTDAGDCGSVIIGNKSLTELCGKAHHDMNDQVEVLDIAGQGVAMGPVKVIFKAASGKATPRIMEVRLLKTL